MADESDRKKKKKGGGGARKTALAALLAVVAVLAAWLSNCIPGFGFGTDGEADGEAEDQDAAAEAKEAAKPEEPKPEEAKPEEPKPEEPAGTTLTVTIDVRGCAVAGAEPVDCASVCEQAELFEGVDDAILDVREASHESVVAMTDCLKSKGIDKVAIRRE